VLQFLVWDYSDRGRVYLSGGTTGVPPAPMTTPAPPGTVSRARHWGPVGILGHRASYWSRGGYTHALLAAVEGLSTLVKSGHHQTRWEGRWRQARVPAG
jgi:hypothetical protein